MFYRTFQPYALSTLCNWHQEPRLTTPLQHAPPTRLPIRVRKLEITTRVALDRHDVSQSLFEHQVFDPHEARSRPVGEQCVPVAQCVRTSRIGGERATIRVGIHRSAPHQIAQQPWHTYGYRRGCPIRTQTIPGYLNFRDAAIGWRLPRRRIGWRVWAAREGRARRWRTRACICRMRP